jgi:enamine deaminase RidA (YjgF/YER057c/UK114 family)
MAVERIQPDGLATPPTYSHVVKAGNTVYIAGQVSQNEHGQLVGAGDFVAQATQVFENLGKALASAGAGFEHLVKITVFVTDPRYREPLSAVRSKYLASNALPASTLLVVAGLALPEYLLEIEAVAVVE